MVWGGGGYRQTDLLDLVFRMSPVSARSHVPMAAEYAEPAESMALSDAWRAPGGAPGSKLRVLDFGKRKERVCGFRCFFHTTYAQGCWGFAYCFKSSKEGVPSKKDTPKYSADQQKESNKHHPFVGEIPGSRTPFWILAKLQVISRRKALVLDWMWHPTKRVPVFDEPKDLHHPRFKSW